MTKGCSIFSPFHSSFPNALQRFRFAFPLAIASRCPKRPKQSPQGSEWSTLYPSLARGKQLLNDFLTASAARVCLDRVILFPLPCQWWKFLVYVSDSTLYSPQSVCNGCLLVGDRFTLFITFSTRGSVPFRSSCPFPRPRKTGPWNKGCFSNQNPGTSGAIGLIYY